MKKVAFTNDTENTIHVGPKSVRPNETREVDPSMIPPKYKNKAHGLESVEQQPTETVANPLLDILDNNVATVLTALAEKNEVGEYKYSSEDLQAIAEAEDNGKTRVGVMEGIGAELLSRASQTTEAGELVKELAEMSAEDLTAALDLYNGDDGKIALVQAEIDKRTKT